MPRRGPAEQEPVRALDQLRYLPEPPARDSETATLRRVRQSRRYPLW